MARLDEPVDRYERIEALQRQIDELKQQHQAEQLRRREAIAEQADEMRSAQADERQARREAIQRQIDEIRRLHGEQQECQKALREQIAELKRLEQAERKESKKGLRLGLVLKLGKTGDLPAIKDDTGGPESLPDHTDPEARKGFLKLHILDVLAAGPSHGYEIMGLISRRTGDAWKPSPGSLYPALETLELKGFVYCQGDGRRKVYTLTKKGKDVLARVKVKQDEQLFEMKSFMTALFEE